MNYYELIYLKNELKNKLTGCWVEQMITPFRNQLECFIAGETKSFRLIFSAAPGNSALFLDTYRPGKKSNALQFFTEIYGLKISDLGVLKHDRFFWLEFENGNRLWFRLFGSKANALLAENGIVTASFKDHNEVGDKAPSAPDMQLFDMSQAEDTVLRTMQKLNPLYPKWEMKALIEHQQLEDKPVDELAEFLRACTEQKEQNPEFRLLIDGHVTLLNEAHLPIPTHKNTQSVNELIAYRFKNYSQQQRLNHQKNELMKVLKRQIKRLDSSLLNLAKAEKGLEKAELYEKYGHLLMAQAHLPKPEKTPLETEDFYDEGRVIRIPVNTELSMVENAQHYYDRSSASITSFEEAEKRLPKLEQRQIRLSKMLEGLKDVQQLYNLEDWKKINRKELETLGLGKKQHQEQNLPFHTLTLDGYQIWIGKNAKSNDKLVQLSHKEDIWMHARGVPGSHLIVRMNNRKDMPETSLIEKAAAFAAYQSKAKGSKLVPVIFTKRKYVRKPKGAAPGAVLVQKEEVAIVEPKNPME